MVSERFETLAENVGAYRGDAGVVADLEALRALASPCVEEVKAHVRALAARRILAVVVLVLPTQDHSMSTRLVSK